MIPSVPFVPCREMRSVADKRREGKVVGGLSAIQDGHSSVIYLSLFYLFGTLFFTSSICFLHTFKMGRSALLIGNITHARKEWEELGSLIELKVGGHSVISCMATAD